MNAAGISVLWDLNDVVVTAGYDYIIERYTGGSAEANDRDSHQFQLAVAFLLNETTTAGIQSSAFSTGGMGTMGEEQTMLSLGPFLEFHLTPFTRFILSAGIQQSESQGASSDDRGDGFFFDEDGRLVESDLTIENDDDDAGSDTGYYWSFAAHNKLNRWYTHSLTAGHERQVGFGANYVDLDYIRYTAAWLVNSNISLEFNTGLEHHEESQGLDPETLDRWFAGIGFSYRLRENLSTTFRYSYFSKTSDLQFRDYRQNIVTVGFVYDF